MGMINTASEINKILFETTSVFEECATILAGPKVVGKGTPPEIPKDSPECLTEDLALIREKALHLRELSLMISDILRGKEIVASDGKYEGRY